MKPKKAIQQAAHSIVLLYEQSSCDNVSLIFFIMYIAISSLTYLCGMMCSLALLDSAQDLMQPWSKLKVELHMGSSRDM